MLHVSGSECQRAQEEQVIPTQEAWKAFEHERGVAGLGRVSWQQMQEALEGDAPLFIFLRIKKLSSPDG